MVVGGVIFHDDLQGPRLHPVEVESLFLTCWTNGTNQDASRPAQPVYWTRQESAKEN